MFHTISKKMLERKVQSCTNSMSLGPSSSKSAWGIRPLCHNAVSYKERLKNFFVWIYSTDTLNLGPSLAPSITARRLLLPQILLSVNMPREKEIGFVNNTVLAIKSPSSSSERTQQNVQCTSLSCTVTNCNSWYLYLLNLKNDFTSRILYTVERGDQPSCSLFSSLSLLQTKLLKLHSPQFQ